MRAADRSTVIAEDEGRRWLRAINAGRRSGAQESSQEGERISHVVPIPLFRLVE
jgi:hypothetical protein